MYITERLVIIIISNTAKKIDKNTSGNRAFSNKAFKKKTKSNIDVFLV